MCCHPLALASCSVAWRSCVLTPCLRKRSPCQAGLPEGHPTNRITFVARRRRGTRSWLCWRKLLPSIEPLLHRFWTLDDRRCNLRSHPGTAEHGCGKGACNEWT